MLEQIQILRHFITARWLRRFSSREALLAWQQKQLNRFLRQAVRECPFYTGLPPRLDALPVIDKPVYRQHFSQLNRHGIELAEAEDFALEAERSREFSNALKKGRISVGLSSGTSGQRSVFLVSPGDRTRWAGIVLARILSRDSLKQLVSPWCRPLRVAFFLRADSNLYRTVANRRLAFHFFDLLSPLSSHLQKLETLSPDILIAPASVLAEISRSAPPSLRPRQIISVAEVLDPADASVISSRFGVRPADIYQAAEGFLASTCAAGSLHLNEEFLHIEREWLDESKTRFHPIVTDFSRETQYFIRYRLEDILQIDPSPCNCGRPTRVIRSIDGRSDEFLHFGAPLFPDIVRQLFYSLPEPPLHYRVEQHASELHIFLPNAIAPEVREQIRDAIHDLFLRHGLTSPAQILFRPWTAPPPGDKLRRIRCVTPLPPP